MIIEAKYLLLAGAVVGGAGAGIVAVKDALNPHEQYGFNSFPQEGRKLVEARLAPVLSNYSGRLDGPAVRKKPQISGELIKESDLSERGVNVHQTLRGFKVLGGSYPSNDNRGRFLKQGEITYGKWLAIVDSKDEVVGYVAENFVTYQAKSPK